MKKRIVWLDDMRHPFNMEWAKVIYDNVPIKYISNIDILWLKDFDEFENHIKNEMPFMIFFDHDLGTGKSGYDAAKLLVDKCLDADIDVPDWYVQSSNPAGKENINKLLTNYRKFYRKSKKGKKG